MWRLILCAVLYLILLLMLTLSDLSRVHFSGRTLSSFRATRGTASLEFFHGSLA